MNPKTMLSPFVLAALLVALAFSSCSKVDDMHDATLRMDATTAKMAAITAEMNTKTEQLKNSTQRMNENTQQMKSTTEDMGGVMTSIYDSGRQGAAIDLRNKQWDLLIHAGKPDEKGAHAALFFQEFEFELWGRSGRDRLEGQRLRLMKDAACEFFGRLLSITHWESEELDPLAGAGAPKLIRNPLEQADADNEKASFNALAVTLESINRQEELVADANPPVTMLTIIETALSAGKQIRAGKAKLADYPAYVDLVLQQEELAVRLLRARHQMMGLAVLCQVTTMCRDLGEGAKFAKLGARWQLDFSQLNESQTRLISFRLGEAIAARNFLADLGVQSELDPTIRSVYSHGSVAGALDPKAAKQPELARAQAEVVSRLRDYLK